MLRLFFLRDRGLNLASTAGHRSRRCARLSSDNRPPPGDASAEFAAAPDLQLGRQAAAAGKPTGDRGGGPLAAAGEPTDGDNLASVRGSVPRGGPPAQPVGGRSLLGLDPAVLLGLPGDPSPAPYVPAGVPRLGSPQADQHLRAVHALAPHRSAAAARRLQRPGSEALLQAVPLQQRLRPGLSPAAHSDHQDLRREPVLRPGHHHGSQHSGNAVKRSLPEIASPSGRQNNTIGEIVNFSQLDTSRMEGVASSIHILWDGSLQVIGYTLLLLHFLGPAVFAGILAMVGTIPLNTFFLTRYPYHI